MKRNLAVLTLLILVGLCACDTRELSPSTSPTPGVARARSPAPTSTATPTATPISSPTAISSGGSVTSTREPIITPSSTRVYHTVTPLPSATATPTPTATPSPTDVPLPQLPSWLYPTDPRERESFDRVRLTYYRFAHQIRPRCLDVSESDFSRACRELNQAANAYLGEFPGTMTAAAVYAMSGIVDETRWYLARGGFPFGCPELYVSSQHNEGYDRAIELYLAHNRDLNVSLVEGLRAIELPVAWSQNADVDGDARPDVLLGLDLQGQGVLGYLYVLHADDQGNIVSHQVLTHYVDGEGKKLGHGIEKIEIEDINRDGRTEIVTQNVYAYWGGPGLYVNVFQWQGDDFVNVLDWEGPDLYYGSMRTRVLSQTGAQEIIMWGGKHPPTWVSSLPVGLTKTFFYQWDGQRYTFQLPLRYSEYYDHAEENGHYYFFEKRDYAKALAEYEQTLARYRAQYGKEYEQVKVYDPYLTPWCHINIVVCHKALGDEARFQEAYAAFREKYPQWVWTLDEQLLELRADTQDLGLTHAWHDGTTWHVETVPTGSQGSVGSGIALALDAAGRPHFAYHDYMYDKLKYTWHDGSAWHVETIAEEAYDLFVCPSLALDGAGQPHISYNDFDLKYTWYDGTTWHFRTVGGAGHLGSRIALDQADQPHIGYYSHTSDFAREDLKYAWYDGTAWHAETVTSGESLDLSDLCMVLDGAGQPHMSYHNYTSGELQYVWRDGTTWHAETIPVELQEETSFALALDPADRPCIGYYDHTASALRYAWRDGTTWHVETVGSTGDVGSISLVVDKAGHPHIGYYDHTHGDVEYAWHDGTTWRVETVASPGIVRSNVTLVLDGAGHPHIGYYSEAGDD